MLESSPEFCKNGVMMEEATYYRDHWVEIEPDRLDAYEQMFRWRPEMDPLIEPASLGEGQSVMDYGCGPGWLAIEIARRVGSSGHVHAVDLNADFLGRAERNATTAGLRERISFHRMLGERVSLEDRLVDRVITKNVLEYVTDLDQTLRELRRVLRPAGLLHVIDSDWGMLAVEPLGAERTRELFAAASIAYREPLIGRKLYGAMRKAGFSDVRVKVLAGADTRGHFAPIVFNMASYARAIGRLDSAKIDRLIADLKAAIETGDYLLVLPQFLVTGTA